LLVLSYFGYQKYQENAKNADLADFAKTHNQNLEKTNKAKVETSIPKEKANKDEKISETLTQESGSVKIAKKVQSEEITERELTGKELEDYNKSFEASPRKIVPYTEPLPEMPDEATAKAMFVDTNNNGVRDDVEIAIVKEFGDDKELVKSYFAQARSFEYRQYIAENDLLYGEYLQKAVDNVRLDVDCRYFVFKSRNIEEAENFLKGNGYDLYEIYNNTSDREKNNDMVYRAFHGHSSAVKVTEESCEKFFEESKTWSEL